MSIEGQPNTILTVYSPFAWIEDTGSFVNFPTTQDALIKFPGTIGCSEIVGFNSTLINVSSDLAIGTGFTFFADEIEANAGSSINIVTLNDKAVNIGTSTIRTSNINIGSNPSAIVGETTGNVNIMCGAGLQEGPFNVLTNSTNRGEINIGNTGGFEGGINIYARFKTGIKVSWGVTTYSGFDTFLGAYKETVYNTATSLSLNTTDKRIVGSFPSLVTTGVYQLNVHTTMRTSVVSPWLTYGIYTKIGATAWVDGALMTGGTLVTSLERQNRNYTLATSEKFTMSISGLFVITPKAHVAIVVGEGNTAVSQNITFVDTFMSVIRVG